LVGADLPNPGASSLGGIESYAAVTNQWINAISTSGVPSSSQPAFSNLSGTAAVAQGGTGLASGTDGGILGFTASGTLASSAVLTANRIVIGGGAGATPTVLGSLGTTTTVLHGNASGAPTFGAVANSDLTNSSVTINTHSLSLGGSLTLAFSDFAGTVAAGQLPNPSSTTLGGIESLASSASKWINQISTSGVPSATQPAFTDISGSVAVTQGGTGNAFFTVSGPATSAKTFTFPNASSTVLTDNAAVTVAQGGTGITSGTSGGIPYYSATSTIASSALLAANNVMVGGGAGTAPATEADWSFSSHILIGNLNTAALPAAPTGTALQIGNADAVGSSVTIDSFAAGPNIIFRRANTTAASPSAIAANDVLGRNQAFGYHSGGAYTTNARARVVYTATEAWTSSAQGAKTTIDTTPIGSTTIATVATFNNSGCSFTGTTTNDNASAGFYGEVINSSILIASEVTLTTATTANVTSISLTAGDWEVYGNVTYDFNGTTATKINAAISTTSATLPTSATAGGISKFNVTTTTLTDTAAFDTPLSGVRMSLSGTTTVYLVARAIFSAGTTKAYGFIEARRMR
jgi:hypothetical protein